MEMKEQVQKSKFVILALVLLLSTEVTILGIKHSGTKADTETLYAAEWNAEHVNTGTDGVFLKWIDGDQTPLPSTNRVASLTWTDLDLTASTSANAKLAILRLKIHVNVGNKAYAIRVRKNGTTPNNPSILASPWACTGADDYFSTVVVGVDTGQVIEYCFDVEAGGNVDFQIDVLGYWE
jgi:hypothetical protein